MHLIENCLTPLVTVAANFKYKVPAFVSLSALIVDDSKYCLINMCSPFEITSKITTPNNVKEYTRSITLSSTHKASLSRLGLLITVVN